jgi:hypothetical protein
VRLVAADFERSTLLALRSIGDQEKADLSIRLSSAAQTLDDDGGSLRDAQ